MAKLFQFTSGITQDRTAFFVWVTLPQQREQYPDFERLLYEMPYGNVRALNDGSTEPSVYIHLDVARDNCKGLFIRLGRKGSKGTSDQLSFLNLKEKQGYAAANCLGWEEARDVVIYYMSKVNEPKHSNILYLH